MTESYPLVLANQTSLGTSTFAERVAVAAAAGFDGLGLGLANYRQITSQEMSPERMRAVLDESGVSVIDLEGVFGYAVDPSETGRPFAGGFSYTTESDIDDLLKMAELFGATRLLASGAFVEDLESDAPERFARLCDRAADLGLDVALEYVSLSNVPDCVVASEIVSRAGRQNGGICVDIWHHLRGGRDLKILRSIPREQIKMIQLSDGALQPESPDYFTETMTLRRLPGSGEFDCEGFLEVLSGCDPMTPISLEVMSTDLVEVDPKLAAQLGASVLSELTSSWR